MFTKFDTVWLMAGEGGVSRYVRTLPVYAYARTFTYLQAGVGAALAVIMFVMLLVATVFFLPVLRGEEASACAGALLDRAAGLSGAGSVLLLLGAFPLFWMLSTSLKPSGEIFATPTLVPRHATLGNFVQLLAETNFAVYFKNSVIVSLTTVVVTLAASAAGAYALTRFAFRGRDTVIRLILATYMFAPIMIIIPFYILVRQLGLVNTRLALVLSYTTFCLPFCLWLLRAFFAGVPLELEEAAMVDGA